MDEGRTDGALCLARRPANVTFSWRVILSENRYPLFGITRYQPPPPPPPPPPPEPPPPPPEKPEEPDDTGIELTSAEVAPATVAPTALEKSPPDQLDPPYQAGW